MSVRPAVAEIIQTLQTNQARMVNAARYGGSAPSERVVNFVLNQRPYLISWQNEEAESEGLPGAIEL